MIYTPHKYQVEAIRLLIKQACAGLFLSPGLGKTSIVLSALNILKSKGYVQHTLIIAPLRVIYTVWPNEILKWDNFNHFRISLLHGANKERALQQDADIYLINPEGLEWLFQAARWREVRGKFDALVIDESTKFKHTGTQRFKTLRKFLGSFKRRYILTGSPAPNGLMDLFGQIYILDEGHSLGRFITHYRNTFFYPSGYGGYEWRPHHDAMKRITERISPLILQMQAEDYLELPELINTNIVCNLPEVAQRTYREMEEDFFTILEDTELTAVNAAAAGVKCRQVANGALYGAPVAHRPNEKQVHTVHDAKLEALEDLIEELSGQPLLVLYEFVHDRDRICFHLGGEEIPHLGGGVSAKKSNEIIARFNAGELPLLLGHPASMGHGLNLQGACHHVCFFGITWDRELYDQSIQRVHRQGQKAERTFVYHIVAKNTLDEKVLKVLHRKGKTQNDVLNALKRIRVGRRS